MISAVATGAAAVVLKLFEPAPPSPEPKPKPEIDGSYVDADTMTKEQQDLLMQELDGHI